MRSQRRRDLLQILHEGRATSQRDIVRALRAAGHDVTQATVSRDLKEIGALKIRSDGEYVYRLADDVPRSAHADLVARHLELTLSGFALDIRRSGALVVVLTAPGHAAAVARAIDLAGSEDVVGSVAGDDTIFVATEGTATAERLVARWRDVLSSTAPAR
jgi:transcriptional regulator of arginine metabolism